MYLANYMDYSSIVMLIIIIIISLIKPKFVLAANEQWQIWHMSVMNRKINAFGLLGSSWRYSGICLLSVDCG